MVSRYDGVGSSTCTETPLVGGPGPSVIEQFYALEEQMRPAVSARAPEASSCAPAEEMIKAAGEAL